ncbi:hypothetical protein ACJIZ3_008106 [Penstemon smallii]|uniref:HTH myb-type domain-containing protein n=1 Tax=Penstemon smallii TaxID=265156 RepID=A0ABD3T9J0_9LAMI
MGENLKGVGLNVGSNSVLDNMSEILTEVSLIDDPSKKIRKLDSYIFSLEEEVRKIDGFKRELPESMNLLLNAIKKLKKESLKYKRKEAGTISEEFVLLKGTSERNGGAKRPNDFNEKKNWMNSPLKLWDTPIKYQNDFNFENQHYAMHQEPLRYFQGEGSGSGSAIRFYGHGYHNSGGAFMPYKREKKTTLPPAAFHDELTLSIVPVQHIDLNVREDDYVSRYQMQQHQEHELKKFRRCWTSDLHEKFVNALDQLGGAQSATPKQIRQLMKVDGLTNDEVKSHLQKYRIHIKKLPTASDAGPSTNSGSPQGPPNNGEDAEGGGSSTGGNSMERDS